MTHSCNGRAVCRISLSAAALIACAGACVSPALAGVECEPAWQPTGAAVPGLESIRAAAAVMWDPDGAGPQQQVLVVGGSFTVAGETSVRNLAAWDGTSWSDIGGGIKSGRDAYDNNVVNALAVLPTGELVVGGDFSQAGNQTIYHLAKFNGTAWSAFSGEGMSAAVRALAVMPNGDLVAGGDFTFIADDVSPPVNRVARWNGSTWSGLGNGTNNRVYALASTPNGDLYVGGQFSSASNVANTGRIAKFTSGGAWQALGTGASSTVLRLLAVGNNDVIAAGWFGNTSGVGGTGQIARWNGTAWTSIGGGLESDGVVGLARSASGDIFAALSYGDVQRFDGSEWASIPGSPSIDDELQAAMLVMPDGRLIVGSDFSSNTVGSADVSNIAAWDGNAWSALGPARSNTLRRAFGGSGQINATLALPGGGMIVGGQFDEIHGVSAANIAQWNGTTWSALGTGLEMTPQCLVRMPSGDIIAAGSSGIYRWNGTAWTQINAIGANGTQTLAVSEDGQLVAAGTNVLRIWDGTTWTDAFTIDPFPSLNGFPITAVKVLPTGIGSKIPGTMGGDILAAGYGAVAIYAWSGDWDQIGGTDPLAFIQPASLAVLPNFDIVVGGRYDLEDEYIPPFNHIVRYNGSSWNAMGTGVHEIDGDEIHPTVNSMVVMPNGDLIVGGGFYSAGNQLNTYGIARWNGSAWSSVDGGMSGEVNSLSLLADGTLAAGGEFNTAGGSVSIGLAFYGCPAAPTCPADFNGDNTRDVSDLFAYINAWLAKTANADFNDSGNVDVADLFAYINAWLAGC